MSMASTEGILGGSGVKNGAFYAFWGLCLDKFTNPYEITQRLFAPISVRY